MYDGRHAWHGSDDGRLCLVADPFAMGGMPGGDPFDPALALPDDDPVL